MELELQIGDARLGAVVPEEPLQQQPLEGGKLPLRILPLAEEIVGLREEEGTGLLLLDRDVPFHREAHDRCGQVRGVQPLVDQRPRFRGEDRPAGLLRGGVGHHEGVPRGWVLPLPVPKTRHEREGERDGEERPVLTGVHPEEESAPAGGGGYDPLVPSDHDGHSFPGPEIPRGRKVARSLPEAASHASSRDPRGPVKQRVRGGAGFDPQAKVTEAEADPISTGQSFPVTFQYSSSWSGKGTIAFSTEYRRTICLAAVDEPVRIADPDPDEAPAPFDTVPKCRPGRPADRFDPDGHDGRLPELVRVPEGDVPEDAVTRAEEFRFDRFGHPDRGVFPDLDVGVERPDGKIFRPGRQGGHRGEEEQEKRKDRRGGCDRSPCPPRGGRVRTAGHRSAPLPPPNRDGRTLPG